MQFLKPLEVKIRQIRNKFISILHKGDQVHCPICNHGFKKFLPAGTNARYRLNAVCPYCRSRERDRLSWTFLHQHPELFQNKLMNLLHIAPEPCLASYISQKAGNNYITADLMRKDVMVKMDVVDIQYPDNYFDAIYCSHVLQDVPDDNKAMAEFNRVLKPNGWAVLNVPIFVEKTVINSTPDNVRAKGDARPDEHVRSYGLNYKEQLESHGFTVFVWDAAKLFPEESERERLGINGSRTGYIHLVRKIQSSPV